MLSRHVLFERAAFPTSHQMHIHCDVWTWDIHEWRAICSVDDVLFLYHGCQSESPATTCKISGVRQWPGKFPTRLWSGNYQQNHWLLSLWTKLLNLSLINYICLRRWSFEIETCVTCGFKLCPEQNMRAKSGFPGKTGIYTHTAE